MRAASSEPSSMRVLEIVADGSPGGGTTHVLQVLRGFLDGCSIGLVTQRDSYLLEEAKSLGVPVFGLDFFRSRLDLRVPLRLRRITREFGPSVVHVHGGRAAFFCSLAPSETPAVYTVHGYHFVHKNPVMRRLGLGAERLAARRFEEVVFVSEHDRQLSKAHNILSAKSRANVIHNGISLPGLTIHGAAQCKHIGFVGRLEDSKDPFLFLDTIELLPEYTATIVGGGALEEEVRAEIGRRNLSHIRMMGSVSHLETLQVLSTFSILVMTSRWEAFGYSAVEAMWAGVPVIATNVGGVSEIIENGESGLLIDSRSPEEIAEAVRRVTQDQSLRRNIVRNGQERVRSRFSEERMLDGIWKVYQRLVDG